MTEEFFTISLDHNGEHYEGRVSPEHIDKYKIPKSYHVVLNDVFFGFLSRTNNSWQASEWRPDDLVQAVGKCIEQAEPTLQSKP